MTAKVRLNGKISAAATSPGRARGAGLDEAGKTPSPARPDPMRIGYDSSSLSAQWSREQRLSAALRQIDDLRRLNTVLKAECDLLAESLAKAHRFAHHDPLTGLPNRRLLADHFDQAVAQAMRKHNYVVLLFIDLDGFKDINDAIGHTAADRLLQQVASRLSSCVRGSDTVCRYGGDELVVLLPDVDRREQALAVVGKIRSQLAQPYDIEGTLIRATASLGMATFPTDGTDCFELTRAADLAMYREKKKIVVTPDQPGDDDAPARRRDGANPPTPPRSLFNNQSTKKTRRAFARRALNERG